MIEENNKQEQEISGNDFILPSGISMDNISFDRTVEILLEFAEWSVKSVEGKCISSNH